MATVATLWYLSDADLAAIDRRSAVMGVPASWQAVGVVRSDARRIGDWNRLATLATALGSYADSYGDGYDRSRPPVPGEAVPPELVAFHAGLPAGELSELLALCDGLAAGPLVLHTSVTWATRMPEIDALRRACRLLVERAALADPHGVADETERILHLATSQRPVSIIQGLVGISQLSMWTGAAARRMREPGVDRQRLAQQARTGRRWLAEAMPQAWQGEYVQARTILHEAVRGPSDTARGLAQAVGLPVGPAGLGLGRPMLRQARGPVLGMGLDLLATVSGGYDHRRRLADVDALRSRPHAWDWTPSHRLAALLLDPLSMSAASWARADVGLAVVEAELTGAPWPDDPMDPSGHAVRRIERDGRLIGYYLVGRNGVDDGGRTQSPSDDCVPLFERLGQPRAGSPLPVPKPVEGPTPPGRLAPAYYFGG